MSGDLSRARVAGVGPGGAALLQADVLLQVARDAHQMDENQVQLIKGPATRAGQPHPRCTQFRTIIERD